MQDALKSPVIIQNIVTQKRAMHFDGTNFLEIVQHFGDQDFNQVGEKLIIDTLEGKMLVDPGNWVVEGIKGEHYPVKADIFDASYEVL